MPRIDWIIFYGDGSEFTSTDGPPEEAPGLNVQLIAQADEEVGRVLVTSDPGLYWWEDGLWCGCNDRMGIGFWDYLARPGLKVTKFGRVLSNSDFQRVLRLATDHPGLPRKSARRRDEPEVVEG